MLQRALGRTGLNVSVIGLGTWNIGGQWGDVSDDTAITTVRTAQESGVTLFDTADAYGIPVGRSEELLGRAIRDVRKNVVIATKVGNFGRRDGAALAYSHPLHVELCCDASLHRLGVDVIDLYQCHIGDLPDPGVFLQAFDTLKRKGKIRFGGLSTNNVQALKAFNRDNSCDVVQLDYSFINRKAEAELLPYCRQHNIGVLVRGPLAKGVAAGKMTPQTVFKDTVRKGWNEGEAHQKLLEDLKKVDRVRFLEASGRTMAQAALQYVISHPAVTCAIPGAKSPEQARQNASAGNGTLSPEELQRVQSSLG